jgi:hypothetical protein
MNASVYDLGSEYGRVSDYSKKKKVPIRSPAYLYAMLCPFSIVITNQPTT